MSWIWFVLRVGSGRVLGCKLFTEEEYDGGGFEGEIDHDLVVGDRRYGGRLRETRD